MTQKTYIINKDEYRFTEQIRGYIRMDINKRIDMHTTFYNWDQVEKYVNNLINETNI